MKALYLFGNRLKQYFLRNKLIFCLFVIGGVINAISLTYCYGNLVWRNANRNSQSLQLREYMISFAGTSPDFKDIKRFSADPLIECCVISDGSGVYAYDGKFPMTRLSGTTEFTGAYQVIAPATAKVSAGDTFTYQGKSFEVIGTATSSYGSYYIPWDTFTELCDLSQIRQINVISSTHESATNDRVIALAAITFPYASYIGGNAYLCDQLEESQAEQMLPVIVLNAFFSVIAYSFLLRYLIDSRIHDTLVCMVVGASKAKMLQYTFWEVTVLSLSANGLGLLLHWLLYEPLFTVLNISPDLRYNINEYFMLCLVLLVLSLLAIIPIMFKYLRLSPIAARRAHD